MSEVHLHRPEQDAGLRIAASATHAFPRGEHAARLGLLAAEEVVLAVVVEGGATVVVQEAAKGMAEGGEPKSYLIVDLTIK